MTAAPAIQSRLKLKLKVVAGPHVNEVYSLEQDMIRLGRGEDNQIKLIQDSRVSRNHVQITWSGSCYRFKNLSSKNFIMLDGKVLEEGDLKPGCKLQIGETLIEVFEEGPILVPTQPSAGGTQVPSAPRPANSILKPQAVTPQAAVRATQPAQAKRAQAPGPAMAAQQKPKPAPNYRSSQNSSRTNFYIIIAVVVIGFFWLLMQDSKPKEVKTFRTSQAVEYDILQSAEERKKLEERIEQQNSTTAKRAQENLIKGFRDYQQGNFARARDNFQVVLNLDPDNEVAKRYYHLSKIKFDELLQFHMLQGLRYRDKRNHRMCRSSFQAALVMIQNNANHPKYREIKNFFDECNLAIEGRF